MRKHIVLGMAAVLALGVVMSALGADPGAKTQGQTKTGIVKKVDTTAKTVVVMVKRELTFAVTDATKIVQGDAVKTLADIKEGDSVTVEYMHEGKDNRVASRIAIAVAAPVAPPAQ
jgi:Cu/Ag efflux protein CusF